MTKSKEWDLIDPTKELDKKNFLLLFDYLPLNTLEEEKLKTQYWGIYEKFLEVGVDPKDSWIATRNLFATKESQIGERIENQNFELK